MSSYSKHFAILWTERQILSSRSNCVFEVVHKYRYLVLVLSITLVIGTVDISTFVALTMF